MIVLYSSIWIFQCLIQCNVYRFAFDQSVILLAALIDRTVIIYWFKKMFQMQWNILDRRNRQFNLIQIKCLRFLMENRFTHFIDLFSLFFFIILFVRRKSILSSRNCQIVSLLLLSESISGKTANFIRIFYWHDNSVSSNFNFFVKTGNEILNEKQFEKKTN